MAIELKTLDWVEILQNKDLTTDLDMNIFQTLYNFENYEASASQIGRILGYKAKRPSGPINLAIGRYAKRISQNYDLTFTVRSDGTIRYWDLFFNGRDEYPYFIWQLKDNLIAALEIIGETAELKYAEELDLEITEKFSEGIKKTVVVNSYERNSKARKACIEYWKPICSVCEFDFEKVYGELGKGFIHVHHLTQISEIGAEYIVDPINDLRPVCPNCHVMIHRTTPPLSIKELKSIIKNNNYS